MTGLIWKTILPMLLVGGVLFSGYHLSTEKAPVFEAVIPPGVLEDSDFEVKLNFIDDAVDYNQPSLPAQRHATDHRCFFRVTGPFDWIDEVEVLLRSDGEAPVRIPVSVRILNDSCRYSGDGQFTFVDRSCAAKVDLESLDDFDISVRVVSSADGRPETYEKQIQFRVVRPGFLD